VHGAMFGLQLQRLHLIDEQMERLNIMIAAAMKPHQDAVMRLAEVPGLGVDSAQQIIAEVGAQASTFASAAELTSWVETCPGKEESAEQNHSSRSAKGNKYMRRVLNQAAHAAVCKKGSYFQTLFRCLLPRLGYKSADPRLWSLRFLCQRDCGRCKEESYELRIPGAAKPLMLRRFMRTSVTSNTAES
jgi:transposase